MSFFPLCRLKGTQPTKTPDIRTMHLEKGGSDEEVGAKSKDPDEINSAMEEFIMCLARQEVLLPL